MVCHLARWATRMNSTKAKTKTNHNSCLSTRLVDRQPCYQKSPYIWKKLQSKQQFFYRNIKCHKIKKYTKERDYAS